MTASPVPGMIPSTLGATLFLIWDVLFSWLKHPLGLPVFPLAVRAELVVSSLTKTLRSCSRSPVSPKISVSKVLVASSSGT